MFELMSLVHQSWRAVIAACDGLATWPLAISLLTTRASTLEPNVVAWNAAISSCEKSTVWQKAFEVLQFMQRRRVEADETTWNTLISTCGRASWWQKSVAVLERLTAASVCSDLSARWFQGIDKVRREKGELEANHPCKLGRKMSLVSTYINMCQQHSHVERLYFQAGSFFFARKPFCRRTEVRSHTTLPSLRVRGAGNGWTPSWFLIGILILMAAKRVGGRAIRRYAFPHDVPSGCVRVWLLLPEASVPWSQRAKFQPSGLASTAEELLAVLADIKGRNSMRHYDDRAASSNVM